MTPRAPASPSCSNLTPSYPCHPFQAVMSQACCYQHRTLSGICVIGHPHWQLTSLSSPPVINWSSVSLTSAFHSSCQLLPGLWLCCDLSLLLSHPSLESHSQQHANLPCPSLFSSCSPHPEFSNSPCHPPPPPPRHTCPEALNGAGDKHTTMWSVP